MYFLIIRRRSSLKLTISSPMFFVVFCFEMWMVHRLSITFPLAKLLNVISAIEKSYALSDVRLYFCGCMIIFLRYSACEDDFIALISSMLGRICSASNSRSALCLAIVFPQNSRQFLFASWRSSSASFLSEDSDHPISFSTYVIKR